MISRSAGIVTDLGTWGSIREEKVPFFVNRIHNLRLGENPGTVQFIIGPPDRADGLMLWCVCGLEAVRSSAMNPLVNLLQII